MKVLLLIAILIAPLGAVASDALERSFSVFGGGGQQLGSTTLSLDQPGAKASSFQTQGYLVEGGITLPFTRSWGVQTSAEYVISLGPNTLNSTTFIEHAELNTLGGKFGIFVGPVTVGGGYQNINAKIRTMNSNGSYLESNYSGGVPMAFANLSFDFYKMFRGTVEVQYRTGKLSGVDSTTGATNVTGLMISIRAYILLGTR